jgi:hypothetical protein
LECGLSTPAPRAVAKATSRRRCFILAEAWLARDVGARSTVVGVRKEKLGVANRWQDLQPVEAVLASRMGYEPIGKIIFVEQLAEIRRLLQLVRSSSMPSERASPTREFFGK